MRPPKRNKRTEAREILSEAVKIQSPWQKISEDLLGKVDAARARGEVRFTDPSMSVYGNFTRFQKPIAERSPVQSLYADISVIVGKDRGAHKVRSAGIEP